MMMMIPEAWGARYHMSEDQRAFYEYHSAIMEPWDGPAAMVFTDGRYVGATLDRNGLRPARYTQTRDGLLVLASETGTVAIEPPTSCAAGGCSPGGCCWWTWSSAGWSRTTRSSRGSPGAGPTAAGCATTASSCAACWARGTSPRGARGAAPQAARLRLHRRGPAQRAGAHGRPRPGAGRVHGPRRRAGRAGRAAGPLAAHFKQLFAQVTNPAIDPLREELVMSLMSYGRPGGQPPGGDPAACRQLKLPHPILTRWTAPGCASRRTRPAGRRGGILFRRAAREALRTALDEVCRRSAEAVRSGTALLILTTGTWMPPARRSRRSWPRPAAPHLVREGLRTRTALVVETGEAREVMHFALLVGYGANAVCHTWRSPRCASWRGRAAGLQAHAGGAADTTSPR